MSLKPVKLSALIEALEFDTDERVTSVDLQNGCVVSVDAALLSALEEADEALAAELADGIEPELEIARAMVDDSGERFVAAPDKFDFHEYRQMERFIGTLDDAGEADQLWRAIKGKGAFRCFKDTADRLGRLQQWYQFRESAMKELVIGWAEVRQIPLVDDTNQETQS